MNNLPIEAFNFNGSQVRVILTEDGEPEWVATDVAKILGYREAYHLTRRLDEDEAGPRSVGIRSSNGVEQTREVTTITEAGLYTAILGSKRPEAKDFKRWVTHEVLPMIRKTGAYVSNNILDSDDPLALLEKALDVAKEERAKRQALEQRVEHDAPKVEFANNVLASDHLISMNGLAKLAYSNGIKIGQNRLFKWMRENEWLTKSVPGHVLHNHPTQKAVDKGVLSYKYHQYYNSATGAVHTSTTPLVTPEGQRFFLKELETYPA